MISGVSDKRFTLYRSSAGSGKTRTLAREYLKLALQYRSGYFRHILAVTFTNKATQEMKDRILSYLHDFANDRPGELGAELKEALQLDDASFRERSREVQQAILHEYASFAISTIDAFFQRVIRSFTHESGIIGDYRLEVEQDAVLEEVVDRLIDELGANVQLTDWVVEFARENLANEKAWDVRSSLISFAGEIFREEFKEIEEEVSQVTGREGYFTTLLQTLRHTRNDLMRQIREKASRGLDVMARHGLIADDFKYAGGAGYSFFRKIDALRALKDWTLTKRDAVELQHLINWPKADSPKKAFILQVVEKELRPLHQEILDLHERHYKQALSAEVALNNFYAFGLIADIARKLKEYKDESNVMLLADAPKFLNGLISDSDTPFVYEKIGSFYRHYLIDEFQDTSGLQWSNFLPLLANGLDQGFPSLVVGDVKQAIYRWRGGNLNILQQVVEEQIGVSRTDMRQLNSNFRSAPLLVNFNNDFFQASARHIAISNGHTQVEAVYRDVHQHAATRTEGFVHIQFMGNGGKERAWEKQALEAIPAWLEKLQEKGIRLRDVAILVRRNEEGQRIVEHLLAYRNSTMAKEGYRYDVISNESLRIDGAATVNLLVAAMRYLLNSMDAVSRAQLSYEFFRLAKRDRTLTEVFDVSNLAFFENNLPPAFSQRKAVLKKLPLIELTETLIHVFDLHEQAGEIAYLLAFQDLVLEFSSRERNDLGAFLDWWAEHGCRKSVQVSGDVDAVQILTVHKAKGLQFPYVMIPFCSWKLDHEATPPILWVTATEPPFDNAGYLPVKYSGALADTVFEGAYEAEMQMTYLDNLNLLYVALTRAESGMIVFAPHHGPGSKGKTVAHLLQDVIETTATFSGQWNKSALTWTDGTLTAPDYFDAQVSNTASLTRLPTAPWRDKLIIRESARDFFDEVNAIREQRIRYGVQLHQVLSRIVYHQDTERALGALEQEGLITPGQRVELATQLGELFSDEQFASWFSPPWQVRTEVPVLLPGGGESRLDRVLIQGKKAVVIDFKTGTPVRADERQVWGYMGLLREMNYHEVEGFLFYIQTGDVVPVKKDRARRVPARDTSQLDLGL